MTDRLLMFDLDGTLADTSSDLCTSMNHVRAMRGLPARPENVLNQYFGHGMRDFAEHAFEDAAAVDIDDVLKDMVAYYSEHLLDRTRLYDGVFKTLTALKGSYRLAVITNKLEPAAQKIMDGLGVTPLLDCLIGERDHLRRKPHPDALLMAMEQTECRAEGSWMIGDNWTDLGAAVNAGVHSCFCTYGFGVREGYRGDLEIDAFSDLTQLL